MSKNNKVKYFTPEYKKQLFEEFINALPKKLCSAENIEHFYKAYNYAYDAHKGVRRKGGQKEPYITHPIQVALIVAHEIGLGTRSIISALLHDVVEDTEITIDDIKYYFDETTARIVDGLTKITNVYNAEQNSQAETFKKMLLSIPQDSRVAFIKLADRLHNMRTMEDMPDGSRQIKAGENLFVYVPIAYKLGLYDIKTELEDLSFRYRSPENYQEILQQVKDTEKQRNGLFDSFITALDMELSISISNFKIIKLQKSLYQAWNKTTKKNITLSELSNFNSIRIVFDTKKSQVSDVYAECYSIYSRIIHVFPERKDSKRDWFNYPKKNGFSALVFEVMYLGKWIEIQITTTEKHEVAQRGYSKSRGQNFGIEELKQDLGKISPNSNADELIDRFQAIVNTTNIYVFTPQGEIIELPKGSTVLDFAFAIHSDLGLHCIGAEINKKIVSINHVLSTTDQIKILDSSHEQPKRKWLNYVKTQKAITKLKTYFRKAHDYEYHRGRDIFVEVLDELNIKLNVKFLKALIYLFKFDNKEEFFENIGSKNIPKDRLLKIVKNEYGKLQRKNIDNEIIEFNSKIPLKIDNTFPYMLALCCSPIPGDDATAYKDENGNIIVHKKNCNTIYKLSASHGKSTTKVEWGTNNPPALANINIEGIDRVGIIRDVAEVLSRKLSINMQAIAFSSEDGVFSGTISLYIFNKKALKELIDQLEQIEGVQAIYRKTSKI